MHSAEALLPRMTLEPWLRSDLLFHYRPGSMALATSASDVRTYIDAGGVVQLAASGAARDADYSTGERGLLVESARTNITHQSLFEDISAWKPYVNIVLTQADYAPGRKACRGTLNANGTSQRLFENAPAGMSVATYYASVLADVSGGLGLGSLYAGRSSGSGGGVVYTEKVRRSLGGNLWLLRYQFDVAPDSVPAAAGIMFEVGNSGQYCDVLAIQTELGAFGTSFIDTTAGAPAARAADAIVAAGVLPAGIHATRYERYWDLATGAEVEQVVDVPSTDADVVLADAGSGVIDRAWYDVAYAAGVLTLSEFQAKL